jgi:aspartate kinase
MSRRRIGERNMSIFVHKFGGTSVGSIERIQHVAKKISLTVKQGHQVVVVVSAIGSSTDTLVNMAKEITPNPDAREMDMLLSTGEQVSVALLTLALHHLQVQAISMTGWQAGIVTEEVHGNAEIIDIQTEKIIPYLQEGKVVVVAGFQGVTEQGQICTLGRGGSDTTAVALAAALKAERCDIFTDVKGVFTADPRIVPLARQIKQISYDEMLELSSLGAKVLHARSVTWAKRHGVNLSVRSAFEDVEGTLINEETVMEDECVVHGITYELDGEELAKIAVVGIEMESHPEVLREILNSLLEAKVDIKRVCTSAMNVSFLIHQADVSTAIQTLHEHLILDKDQKKLAI